MFCGIVETTGKIISAQLIDGCKHLTISPTVAFDDLTIGDSIAVNGACLTVTAFTPTSFDVTLVPETLRLTNLHRLDTSSEVNLERSLTLNKRIGGHYVQGHVDCVGKILTIQPDNGQAWIVAISLPDALSKYVVNKGYITLDGMSITVISAEKNAFTVTFIPHTQNVTITKSYQVGDEVNIEVDMMGKYIHKILGAYNHANSH